MTIGRLFCVFICCISTFDCQAGSIEGLYSIRREYKCNIVTSEGALFTRLYSASARGDCRVENATCKWKTTIESKYYKRNEESTAHISEDFEFDVSSKGIMKRTFLPGTGALHLFPVPLLGFEVFVIPESDAIILERIQFPDYELSIVWELADSGNTVIGFVDLKHNTDPNIVGAGLLERTIANHVLTKSRSDLRFIIDIAELHAAPDLREIIDEIPPGAKAVFVTNTIVTRK